MKEQKNIDNYLIDKSPLKLNNIKYAGTISAGALGILHAASHMIPAITNLGYTIDSHLNHKHSALNPLAIDPNKLEQILHHPITNLASLVFVALGFYYIYKDHRHHKNHHKLISENIDMKTKITNLEKTISKYKEVIKKDTIYY